MKYLYICEECGADTVAVLFLHVSINHRKTNLILRKVMAENFFLVKRSACGRYKWKYLEIGFVFITKVLVEPVFTYMIACQ